MDRSRIRWVVPFTAGMILGYCAASDGLWTTDAAHAQAGKPVFKGQTVVLLERIAKSVDQIARSTQHIERQLRGKDARQRSGTHR